MKRLFRWKQISPPLKLETLIATFWVPETTKRPRCIMASDNGSLKILTTQVASYSILTIQVLVVCLTLVRWLTTVTAKVLTSRQKEKDSQLKELPHRAEKRKRLPAKRKTHGKKKKRLKAKRKPHGRKKKTHGKISSIPRGHFNSYFFCHEVVVNLFAVRLFFLPWGLFFWPWGYSFCREGYSFGREVFLFAVRLILLPWQLWATVPLKFCSRILLIFQHVGIREN